MKQIIPCNNLCINTQTRNIRLRLVLLVWLASCLLTAYANKPNTPSPTNHPYKVICIIDDTNQGQDQGQNQSQNQDKDQDSDPKQEPEEIFLYSGPHTPTEKADHLTKVSDPSITVWLPTPEKATGKAVVICPGGGYGSVVIEREGHRVARAFNAAGVAAFVLKYRLPDKEKEVDQSAWPLEDAQTAIKIVRQRAAEWNIRPDQIGIMGFSAGGHLAATAGTHHQPVIANPEHISVRPDFLILIYPVVSFDDRYGHTGSRNNLLGATPTPEKIALYSNELHVDATTPPTFLTHGTNDAIVKVDNSLIFYNALHQHNVPVEMHIYANGEHGYLQQPSFEEWFGRCLFWLGSF